MGFEAKFGRKSAENRPHNQNSWNQRSCGRNESDVSPPHGGDDIVMLLVPPGTGREAGPAAYWDEQRHL